MDTQPPSLLLPRPEQTSLTMAVTWPRRAAPAAPHESVAARPAIDGLVRCLALMGLSPGVLQGGSVAAG